MEPTLGPGAPGRVGSYRWVICALLFVATTVNYVDRQVIGILKPTLQTELGWSEIDYGNIVFSFQLAYAIGLILVGRLIDRLGTKRGYSLALVVWSVAAMAHALVRSVGGFIAVRFALGFGEAGNFPAAIKSVAEWFPRKERALATGLFNFPRRAVGSMVGIGGMAGAVGGMLIAKITGYVLQFTGSYLVVFIIAGSTYLVALGVIQLIAPRLAPVELGEAG